jgi:hypothetical protein
MTPTFRKLILGNRKAAEQDLQDAISDDRAFKDQHFRGVLRRYRIIREKLWKEIFGGKND